MNVKTVNSMWSNVYSIKMLSVAQYVLLIMFKRFITSMYFVGNAVHFQREPSHMLLIGCDIWLILSLRILKILASLTWLGHSVCNYSVIAFRPPLKLHRTVCVNIYKCLLRWKINGKVNFCHCCQLTEYERLCEPWRA